jgi:tetratricopeptide (TPR) repeat protein
MKKQMLPSARLRKLSWPAGIVTLIVLPAIALSQTKAPSTAQNQSNLDTPHAAASLSDEQNSDSAPDTVRLSAEAKGALDTRQWPEAAAALEKLAKLNPDVAEVHANLGLAYYFEGRPSQAFNSFSRALKLKPVLPQARVMMGICEAELGRNAEAIAILAPAFRKPPDPEIGRLIGLHLQHSYIELKQPDKAIATGEELLKRYPHDAEILFHVSRLYADRSYELMSTLMRTAPNSAWVHYANAQVQESLARYDVAKREYENVIQRQPTMPGVHYRLGRVILLGAPRTPESIAEATQAFEQELANDSRNADAEYELGEINREQGSYSLALEHFSRAVAEQPDFVEARIGLGRTLLKEGQIAQAVPHLKEAVRLDAENKVPHALLANAYRALGDSVAAQAEMDAYQKLNQADMSRLVPAAGAPTAQHIDP